MFSSPDFQASYRFELLTADDGKTMNLLVRTLPVSRAVLATSQKLNCPDVATMSLGFFKCRTIMADVAGLPQEIPYAVGIFYDSIMI